MFIAVCLYNNDKIISSNYIKFLDRFKDILCKEFKTEYLGHKSQVLNISISRDEKQEFLY